jgi:ATP-dependent DNA ligase
MASDKRQFNNFKTFPGKINKDTDMYEFPKLYTQDKSGNTREWAIYVRLIKIASKRGFKKVNWNLTQEDQVTIKPIYLHDDEVLPAGIIAQVWTEAGIIGGEITRSAPTYPPEKNVGRANHRDYFKQALIVARGKYMKKVDEGGQPTRPKPVAAASVPASAELGAKYFPMLAKRYDDYIRKHKLDWPVYVQPKLDGMRCLAYLRPSTHYTVDDVVIYTRKKKDYPHNEFNDAIRAELLPILKKLLGRHTKNESVYLDGELYNHYVKLQDINHYVRTEDLRETVAATKQIQYWIYDAFYPSEAKTPFESRAELLNEIAAEVDDSKVINVTETKLAKTQAELDKFYAAYIKDDYEGMMIRNRAGVYATSSRGSTGLRSADLLKKKEVFTDEYEVVGWTQGSAGKEIGAIIWICQTANRKRFNVTPNLDYVERYKIYKECQSNFASKYANRNLTVEFRGLSEDKVPQHAKGISFRDE